MHRGGGGGGSSLFAEVPIQVFSVQKGSANDFFSSDDNLCKGFGPRSGKGFRPRSGPTFCRTLSGSS